MKKLFTLQKSRKTSALKWLGMAAGILMMQQTYAADFVVSNTADAGVGSFRQAVIDANAGGNGSTISFTIAPGSMITLSTPFAPGGLSALSFTANITVNAPALGISLNRTTTDMRLVAIAANKVVVFNNLNLLNGNLTGTDETGDGGAILLDGKLTMNNCLVNNCVAGRFGGAVRVIATGELYLNNTSMNNNTSGLRGGAISLRGIMGLTSSTISNNTSLGSGGGIDFSTSIAGNNFIEKCIISGNIASENAGGISSENGTLTVNNSQISDNIALGGSTRGGGMSVGGPAASIVTITNTTFSGNTAGARGGGFNLYGGTGPINITNSTFSGNNAPSDGGGVFLSTTSAVSLNNCTVTSNNSSGGGGGGIVTNNGLPEINYCLIVGNTSSGNDYTATRQANGGGNWGSSFGGNVVGSSDAFPSFIGLGGVTTGSVKTANAPSTILSATLANNGGQPGNVLPNSTFTKTHALVTGSIAIDIAGAAYVLATDQRGYFRVDGLEDAGAFEFGGSLPVNFNGDFKASIDGNKAKLSWSVSSESKNDYFLIEKSSDGQNFTEVAKVNSKGTSASSYVAYDNQPTSGVSYYRLSQVDIDGTTVVLGTKPLNFSLVTTASLVVYPNPTTDQIFVDLDNYTQTVTISLTDGSGKQIYSEKVSGGLNNYQLKIGKTLASGVYVLSLNGEDLNEVKKVIVQ